MNKKKKYFCGKILIIGKTNVGKSTLLNRLTNKKISIVSYKKNTTQKNIKSIITNKYYQYIYIDTPGLEYKNNNTIKRKKFYINTKIDIIIFVIELIYWSNIEKYIFEKIKKKKTHIILVINKIDKIKNKNILLPFLQQFKEKKITEIIPISSLTGENINILFKTIKSLLPIKKHKYKNNITINDSKKFFISELIREQCIKLLKHELSDTIEIKINTFKKNLFSYFIDATIFVIHKRHKKIIIGKKGEIIKKCSKLSRKNIEKFLNKKTHLYIWVNQKK
ncbi:GTPase Era [Buchnera aphidicola (Mollitrichosiphum nigrofasciatum)]|uniref:GTPase Era n=1 Tax=Buchnera aphidicola TaxID=9 RepID=UPI0031B8A6BC